MPGFALCHNDFYTQMSTVDTIVVGAAIGVFDVFARWRADLSRLTGRKDTVIPPG